MSILKKIGTRQQSNQQVKSDDSNQPKGTELEQLRQAIAPGVKRAVEERQKTPILQKDEAEPGSGGGGWSLFGRK